MFRCDRLAIRRGTFQLGPLSASVEAGQVVVVIGPNASGKSTLLGMAAGVLPSSEGMVQINGQPLAKCDLASRAAMLAYLPQQPARDLELSVERLVSLGRLRLSSSPELIEEAIEEFELSEIRHRAVSTLSAGQAQRVHLARIWAQRDAESILVLDEPTAPLDPRWADRVWSLLAGHAQNGGVVLVSVHDIAVAADVGDQAWLLANGSLVAAGPAGDVVQPDRLAAVFGAQFEWVVRRNGSAWLVNSGPSAEKADSVHSVDGSR
ncbi:MAG: ABC transporter ATP-binding protein [Phycisphaerae bacterium]|nr:ABC transporter ATP-binding protein [Phycisphaerae bacterium]